MGPTDSEGPAQLAQMVTLISHDRLNGTATMEPYTVLQLHPGTNLILICLSTLCRIMMRIGLMYYLMDILSGFVPGGMSDGSFSFQQKNLGKKDPAWQPPSNFPYLSDG